MSFLSREKIKGIGGFGIFRRLTDTGQAAYFSTAMK
jgi:hypothetical protein